MAGGEPLPALRELPSDHLKADVGMFQVVEETFVVIERGETVHVASRRCVSADNVVAAYWKMPPLFRSRGSTPTEHDPKAILRDA